MKRDVFWNQTVCYAKRLGFVGVCVAFICVVLVDLLERNGAINKETSYSNGVDWTSQSIEENAPTVYCLKEFEQNTISTEDFNLPCLNSERSTIGDCDDYQTTVVKKLNEHLQRKACSNPPSFKDSQRPEISSSMVKRPPIRALLTSPNEFDISFTRHSRKLADIGSIVSGDGPLLIGVVVTTMVVTLGLFTLFLFCCLGRDALKPAKENVSQQEEEKEEDELVVNLRSKEYKGKLGSLQRSMRVSIRNPNINVLLDSVDESRIVSVPPPPGKVALQSTPPASPPPLPPPPPPPGPPTTQQTAAPPPPPQPRPPSSNVPPPPPKSCRPPPPKANNKKKTSGSSSPKHETVNEENKQDSDNEIATTKLKPFFWDKVNAVQGRSMVWHHLKDGSFKFDEEMMVGLFGYVAAQNKKERAKIDSNFQSQPKMVQIIDGKKSQNLAILLKALNVTTEQVCDAVKKGTQLPVELISTLLKMAPTQEEELKLRLYNGDINQLGTSERFLKNLVEIPFAFKRLEVLLFMSSLHEDYHVAKESFSTLEVACNKLTSSRLFLRLLEAVLKTGNRMNDGTYRGGAQAFKLDTLLKLSDVKGTDGKTTLLSFVVQEIIRYEGIKLAINRGLYPTNESPEYLNTLGMEVVSKLSEELDDVKKAAILDGEMLKCTVSKLGSMLKKTKAFMSEEKGATEFDEALTRFMQYAEADIKWMIEEEKRIITLVKSTADYFHGKSGKDEGLRLFAIVRDFLKLLDVTCNEVRKTLPKGSDKVNTPGKTNKYWRSTRNKLIIMNDAVRFILESLYDDDDDDDDDENVTRQQLEETRHPFLPSVHDKLALLAINNQVNGLGSDSDSDDWSSDDDEIKRNLKEANKPSLTALKTKIFESGAEGEIDLLIAADDDERLNDSDAVVINPDGGVKTQSRMDAEHPLEKQASEETNPNPESDVDSETVFPMVNDEMLNDSDAYGLYQDGDVIRQSQKDAEQSVEHVYEEPNRHSLTDDDNELGSSTVKDERLNGSDTDDYYSNGDVIWKSQMVAEYSKTT